MAERALLIVFTLTLVFIALLIIVNTCADLCLGTHGFAQLFKFMDIAFLTASRSLLAATCSETFI